MTRRILLPTALGVAATALALVASAPAQPTTETSTRAPACTKGPVDVEAIIDDSGSMSGTDFNRLRVQGMNLFIDQSLAADRLGALEFGSTAATIFTPTQLGSLSNRATLKGAIDARVQADDGTTNYNDAFDRARTDFAPRSGPRAVSAAIFLTDGAHNEGVYANGHTQLGVPVYVIGFGTGLTDPSDKARLQQIANDTQGSFFDEVDSSTLQSTFSQIQGLLHCFVLSKTFTSTLAQGQSARYSVTPGSGKSVVVTSTWTDPNAAVDLSVRDSRGNIASVAKRKRKRCKRRVKRIRGATFESISITRACRGRLRIRVRGKRVPSSPQTVVTNVQTRGR